MPIRFFSEDIEFKLTTPGRIRQWITKSALKEKKATGEINYIFCSDKYLLALNQQYLNHDTLTDIITFDNSERKTISGEIYISVERVVENSAKYGVELENELRRVIIHGVLHLCGYKDKSATQKSAMRKKEDACLSLWGKLFHVKRSR